MKKTKYTEEENKRMLGAWNAWKDVCWVHGLGKHLENGTVTGTAEDEDLLVRAIAAAFRRLSSPYQNNQDFANLFSDVDWAQEFDTALAEYEHAERYPKGAFGDSDKKLKKKAWKDCVWKAVAESKDPPLKVIFGKLLGPNSKIKDVFNDWLFSHIICGHFDDKNRAWILDKSYEAEAERGKGGGESCWNGEEFVETEGRNLLLPGDKVVNHVAVGGDLIEVPPEWHQALEEAFPPRLCCLMVAYIHGLKIYKDAEVLSALGIGKTTAAKELTKLEGDEKIWGGIAAECRDWLLNDVAGTRFFKKWLEERCGAEKAGQLILSRVKDKVSDGNE